MLGSFLLQVFEMARSWETLGILELSESFWATWPRPGFATFNQRQFEESESPSQSPQKCMWHIIIKSNQIKIKSKSLNSDKNTKICFKPRCCPQISFNLWCTNKSIGLNRISPALDDGAAPVRMRWWLWHSKNRPPVRGGKPVPLLKHVVLATWVLLIYIISKCLRSYHMFTNCVHTVWDHSWLRIGPYKNLIYDAVLLKEGGTFQNKIRKIKRNVVTPNIASRSSKCWNILKNHQLCVMLKLPWVPTPYHLTQLSWQSSGVWDHSNILSSDFESPSCRFWSDHLSNYQIREIPKTTINWLVFGP